MGITLTKPSKSLVKRLIRKEFDEIDVRLEYIYNKAEKLIKTAEEFGLNELAQEMKNDLKTENL